MRPEDRPAPTNRYKVNDLVDELLIYDAKSDKVHVLNDTARAIYLQCDGRRTVEQLARALMQEFDVDRATAMTDTRATIEQLVELGVLSLDASDAAAG